LTWGDILGFFLVLVVGSFIAGFVETWWEKRKWDKQKRKTSE
jgi:Na+-driven multidrug efflux pump